MRSKWDQMKPTPPYRTENAGYFCVAAARTAAQISMHTQAHTHTRVRRENAHARQCIAWLGTVGLKPLMLAVPRQQRPWQIRRTHHTLFGQRHVAHSPRSRSFSPYISAPSAGQCWVPLCTQAGARCELCRCIRWSAAPEACMLEHQLTCAHIADDAHSLCHGPVCLRFGLATHPPSSPPPKSKGRHPGVSGRDLD